MARSIDNLNDSLKTFGRGPLYLDLVGDASCPGLQVRGDAARQIKGIRVDGISAGNSDAGKLYWKLLDAAGTRSLYLYKDSAKTQLVGLATIAGDGRATVVQQSGSGLSGWANLAWTVDDDDAANVMRAEPFDGEVRINDINTGAVSNPLEYMRRFSDYLVLQLDLRTGSDRWLDFLILNFYGVARMPGEADAAYSARAKAAIMASKISPLMIIQALEAYGNNVQIHEDLVGGAFAGVSFSDSYRDFALPAQWVVKGATTFAPGIIAFYFRVTMDTVNPADYRKIADTINSFKAAGVSYDVEITV